MRLIDADAYKDLECDDCNYHSCGTIEECRESCGIMERIDKATTVDAVPVVPAKWENCDWVEPDGHGFGCIHTKKAALRCSNCSCAFKKALLWKRNYCPNCGTRLPGEPEFMPVPEKKLTHDDAESRKGGRHAYYPIEAMPILRNKSAR